MSTSNTNILIKRSTSVGRPGSLRAGELAYSYASNTIFIGSPTGDGVVNVGGQFYTSQIDSATNSATALSLVRRDASGNASFNYITANIIGTIEGVANAAVQLQTSRNFSISGGDITATAQPFNGTAPVTLSASLNNIPGLSGGTYGSSTAIPVLDIAANGRITGVSTASITTSFTVAADTGSNQTVSGGDTLTLVGGSGITSTASATDTVTFDVDNTVVRANTARTLQTIDSNVTITGNLSVQGTQFVTNTTTLNVADPLIYLASNNYTSDLLDIGFAGNYYDGSTERHTGVFRNAGDKEYYIFDNYDKELSSNNEIDVADSSFRKANVNAGYIKSNLIATTASVVTANVTGDLGVGGTIYSHNIIPVANATYSLGSATNRFKDLFLSGTTINLDGATISANAGSITLTNSDGGSLSVTGSGGSATITSDTLTLNNALAVSSGGTGAKTFTSGAILIGNGTGALTPLANVSYSLTGSLGASKTITGLTVDGYGRVSAATAADIAISSSQVSGLAAVATSGAYSDLSGTPSLAAIATSGSASDITSGTLPVPYGGTGQTSFVTNGIIFGNSTNGLQVTSAAGVSDQTWSNQILTTTNAGVPIWSSALDGGTF
jgi:hypothetical protein